MSADPISVTALIVSLVALIITLLQVAQQYAATAYDYRHCSKRTVGGWSRHSHRIFIWSEWRFEVIFSTPTVRIMILPSNNVYDVPTTQPTLHEKSKLSPTLSSFRPHGEAEYHLLSSNVPITSHQNPWFLSLVGTSPEARCGWLVLLNEASSTNLRINIDERKLSYDFMPSGIKRPLAQVDRKSFLTLMSLFQVRWRNGDAGDNILTGAGEFCEVTSRDLVNFGTVFSYHASGTHNPRRYYLGSGKARDAMFNKFDLGFHIILTHSAEELYESLLTLVEESVAATVRNMNSANGGWSPGVSEAIASFAESEMPKCVDHGTDSFMSIYSATPTGSVFGDHPTLKLLIGEEIKCQNEDTKRIRLWTTEFLTFCDSDEAVPSDRLLSAVKQISDQMLRYNARSPVTWLESKNCLSLLTSLDAQLYSLCRLLAPKATILDVHKEFARLQIRYGCRMFPDATNSATLSGGFWLDHATATFAGYYVKIVSDLGDTFPDSEESVRRAFAMNRYFRGILWTTHNGNSARDSSERLLECSLSSRWLADTSAVWLD